MCTTRQKDLRSQGPTLIYGLRPPYVILPVCHPTWSEPPRLSVVRLLNSACWSIVHDDVRAEQEEREMSEQQSQTAVQCSHPEAAGTRWGDSIGEERKAELETWLRQWDEESDHAGRMSPFWQKFLTGADAYWLAQRVRDDVGNVPDLHLEGAALSGAHLEGASLARAHL